MPPAVITQPAAPSVDNGVRLQAASTALGVPLISLARRTIRLEVLRRIPAEVARAERMVAYDETRLPSGRVVLRLAVDNPAQLQKEAPAVIHDLHVKEGMVIDVALTSRADLEAALAQYSEDRGQRTEDRKKDAPSPHLPVPSPQVLPTIDLARRTIPKEVLNRIPEEAARKYRVVVFDVLDQGRTIHVAVERPDNPQIQEFLTFLGRQNQLKVELYQTSGASIEAALRQYRARKPELAKTPRIQTTDDRRQMTEKTKSQITVHKSPMTAKFQKPREEPDPRHTPYAIRNTDVSPKSPATSPDRKVGEVKVSELTVPELHVPPPAPGAETPPLIPIAADVERDMLSLVGQDVADVKTLERIIRTGFIPKIVGAILLLAAHREASDVHIQAAGDQLLVRYRLDGILQDIVKLPVSLQAPIISRIKILSRLKIDEARLPQDGRFDIAAGERAIDLRVSTYPTVFGEKVVIRLLDKSIGLVKFEELGLTGSRLERLRQEIRKPYGVILATGPTGSGKTTLLYAILGEIATPTVNVVTLEDPVEYEIPGIAQSQIQPKIGFGFAEGLRSILRQDPNIIMVGEVRDLETASLVTHAALTGHLVLSTLHTNDAAGALPRLINMGVEPFLITSAMNAIVAQRLVRRVCEQCRISWQPPKEIETELREKLAVGNLAELTEANKREMKLWKAKGCDACHDGYKGRVGIFEVLVMSDAVETLAVKKAPASEMAEAAGREGMVTMEQDGILKALDGLTTLDEVWRVTKTE